tara:strand:- start:387 stop:1034 length:648 start_codon:yes stop_codon:yes gene_type:complete
MKKYRVKEVFYTLQGEGYYAGKAAVFCRFEGCNLWSGLEKDRAKALCSFCDTQFVGTDGQNGGVFTNPKILATHILSFWKDPNQIPFVVFTGGEPLLQLDPPLIQNLKNLGNTIISVETNGTIYPPNDIDHLCVSPKGNSKCKVIKGDEIKIAYPQSQINPKDYEHLEFKHFYLQPIDQPNQLVKEQNIKITLQYCLDHPKWKLSLQTHKILGIH